MKPTAFAAILVLPLLAGCASTSHPDVMASFYPVEFLAQQIAGDDVSIGVVVKPGTEPHEYEATTGDMERLAEARLVLLQGMNFEAWSKAAEQQSDATFVTVTDGIEPRANPDEDELEELPLDPHMWLDPVLFQQMAANVEAALAAEFPEHAVEFHARGQALAARLDDLNNEWQAGLADCEVRAIVTNHAAFGYMATRYDFEMISISGLSPEEEPSPDTMQRVVEEMRDRNITVVFFEDLVSPAVAKAVAREANAETRVLSPIEGIPSNEAGEDYFTRMAENLENLRHGMRCT
jgi:zinc transport system substrate-binding protein